MKIGVPSEVKTDEYRVAITPAGVRELTARGHDVLLEAGAGTGSALSDDDYVMQGATIVADADEVFARAELDHQGQGAAARGGRTAASRTDPVHLPASRRRAGARARADGLRRDVHRV